VEPGLFLIPEIDNVDGARAVVELDWNWIFVVGIGMLTD